MWFGKTVKCETILCPAYIARKLEEGSEEINLECRILMNGNMRWIRNVIIRDSAGDTPRYALDFVSDVTEVKEKKKILKEITNPEQDHESLIKGTVKLVDCYVACDLERDIYHFYSQNMNDSACKPEGKYCEFVEYMASRFKTVSGNLT